MDFYQAVVLEYLRADRSVFANTECCIQLNPSANPDTSGPHWYCDILACDFRSRTVFLCEISFSGSLTALTGRLAGWSENWEAVKAALHRDSHLPSDWVMRPWLFVPETLIPLLLRKLDSFSSPPTAQFTPRITPLEMVQPWRYRSWDRLGEAEKPIVIPEAMRV